MLEILKKQFEKTMTAEEKTNRIREFLQVLLLKIIYDTGFFKNISFVGGTALRILFDLRRFSEDLDFAVIDNTNYNFNKLLSKLSYQLKNYGLNIEIQPKEIKTVQNAMIKFKGILFQLGLSNYKEQEIFVRIEIDKKPPDGWKNEVSLVNKFYVFTVTHFDLPSLYATKLHACFFRKYVKGRDFYDFFWYMGKNITPNFQLLNNAIIQTEGKNPKINSKNIGKFILKGLDKIDLKIVKKEIEHFLDNKEELKLFNKELIVKMLRQKYK